jgi:hypothetical protein
MLIKVFKQTSQFSVKSALAVTDMWGGGGSGGGGGDAGLGFEV